MTQTETLVVVFNGNSQMILLRVFPHFNLHLIENAFKRKFLFLYISRTFLLCYCCWIFLYFFNILYTGFVHERCQINKGYEVTCWKRGTYWKKVKICCFNSLFHLLWPFCFSHITVKESFFQNKSNILLIFIHKKIIANEGHLSLYIFILKKNLILYQVWLILFI